jgi:hypothetical protein
MPEASESRRAVVALVQRLTLSVPGRVIDAVNTGVPAHPDGLSHHHPRCSRSQHQSVPPSSELLPMSGEILRRHRAATQVRPQATQPATEGGEGPREEGQRLERDTVPDKWDMGKWARMKKWLKSKVDGVMDPTRSSGSNASPQARDPEHVQGAGDTVSSPGSNEAGVGPAPVQQGASDDTHGANAEGGDAGMPGRSPTASPQRQGLAPMHDIPVPESSLVSIVGNMYQVQFWLAHFSCRGCARLPPCHGT